MSKSMGKSQGLTLADPGVAAEKMTGHLRNYCSRMYTYDSNIWFRSPFIENNVRNCSKEIYQMKKKESVGKSNKK